MSIEYLVDGKRYVLNYQELCEKYHEFVGLTDRQFRERLPEALHLACIISYLKGINASNLVSDQGVIHLIVHQLHIPDDTTSEFREMRRQFKLFLKLAR